MGIIEDLQEKKRKAERNGVQCAKFLVNQNITLAVKTRQIV